MSSTETLTSGPARSRLSSRRRRQLTVGAVLVAGAVVAVTVAKSPAPAPPAVAFAERWIDAWNHRDAQLVSSMTCPYVGAFVAAGVVEDFLADVPWDRQPAADHTITGTEPAVFFDREGVRVSIRYVAADSGRVRETAMFVRVRDDGDMCIGDFEGW